MVRRAWPWLAAGLLACANASPERTQLVLVSDTDIASIDTIAFEIFGPGRRASVEAPVQGDGSPTYVSLLRENGPLGPLTVTARGYDGANAVIERSAEVWFVEGATRVVRLFLLEACIALQTRCDQDETCTENGCEPKPIAPDDLPAWNGTAPAFSPPADADAGARPMLSECPGAGMVDLANDPSHCGRCENACPRGSSLLNTVAVCVDGECDYACEPLHGNCDDSPLTCESELTSDAHCGACGRACRRGESCSPAGTCAPK